MKKLSFLQRAALTCLCVSTILNSVPLKVMADTTVGGSPTGDQTPIGVTLTVPEDTIANSITLPESVYEYNGQAHKFVDPSQGRNISYDPSVGSAQGRLIDPSNFDVFYAHGTKAEMDAMTEASPGWSATVPEITHVRETQYVRVKIVDNSGTFATALSAVQKQEVIPVRLTVQVRPSQYEKDWGVTDGDVMESTLKVYSVYPEQGSTWREVEEDKNKIHYSLSRDMADPNNAAAKAEDPGDHGLIISVNKTELGVNQGDYVFDCDDANLTINDTNLDNIEAAIDDTDIEGVYDKTAYGLNITDNSKFSATGIASHKILYSDNGGNTWLEAADIDATDVTDANVDSNGNGNGRQVKIVVTGANGSTHTFGPYTIKVRKKKLTLKMSSNPLIWDKGNNPNDPTTSELEELVDESVGLDEVADGDTMTYDVALNPAPAGGYALGQVYPDTINFSNIAITEDATGRDVKNLNYDISVNSAGYKPSNSRVEELTRNFTLNSRTQTYDGKDHYITATGYTNISGEDAVLTYSKSEDDGVTWSGWAAFDNTTVSRKNVGTTKVKVRATLTDCAPVEKEAFITIRKANAKIIAQNVSKKVGSEDPEFTATCQGFATGEAPVAGDYEIARDMVNDPLGDPEKVGEHTGVIKVTLNRAWSNYEVSPVNGNLTITDKHQAALDKITVTGYSGAYDGNSHSISYNNVPAGTVITYSTDNGATWTSTQPFYKDVTVTADGQSITSKKIMAKFTIDDEFVERTEYVKITRQVAYIRAQPATKKEDEEDPKFTATVTGLVGQETFSYEITRTDAGDDTVGTHKGVLVPNILAEYPNYSLHLVSNALTITRGQAYTDVQKFNCKGYSGVYDGAEHSITITASVKGSEVTYSTDKGSSYTTTKPSVKNVKDSTAVYVKCKKGNYEKIVKTELTLTRKQAGIVVNNATKVQGAATPEFSATTDGMVGNDKIDYSLSCTDSDTVGTHQIRCTVTGEYPNYTITVKNGTLTVTKASSTPEKPEEDKKPKGEVIKDDDSKDGKDDGKDSISSGEIIKGDKDVLDLVDPEKYIIDRPKKPISANTARFSVSDDGLEMLLYEGDKKSISTSSVSEGEAAKHRTKAGGAAPLIVGGVIAGAVAVGLGVTGAWSVLWLLLLGLLFAKKRKHWKGLLTYENNMFIKIKGDPEGKEDMQDIIDKGVSVDELKALMESSEVETILPARTRMKIDVDGQGEEDYEADEAKFYEVLENAKGKHVIATIYNNLAKKLSLTIEMDCR